MEYDVVRSHYLEDLIREIDKKLKIGWIPQGGIMYVKEVEYDYPRYLQAIVKEGI